MQSTALTIYLRELSHLHFVLHEVVSLSFLSQVILVPLVFVGVADGLDVGRGGGELYRGRGEAGPLTRLVGRTEQVAETGTGKMGMIQHTCQTEMTKKAEFLD